MVDADTAAAPIPTAAPIARPLHDWLRLIDGIEEGGRISEQESL